MNEWVWILTNLYLQEQASSQADLPVPDISNPTHLSLEDSSFVKHHALVLTSPMGKLGPWD